MKITLLFFFCTFLSIQSNDCYNLLFSNGLKALNKRQFSTAIQKLVAARDCPEKPNDNDLEDWIKKAQQGLRERQAWNRACQADSPESYRRYLDFYPDGYYSAKAEGARERLKKAAEQPVKENMPSGTIDWTQGFVEATGQCAIDSKRVLDNEAQAILMATRGAELVAKANLLETIEGLRISRNTKVSDFLNEQDLIRGNVNGIIKGARMVSEPVVARGMVTVIMRMPVYGASSVVDAVKPYQIAAVEKMEPLSDSTAAELVLHFVEANVHPALYPVVVDDHGILLFDGAAMAGWQNAPIVRYIRPIEVAADAVIIDIQEDEQGRWVAPPEAVPIIQAWMNVRSANGEALPLRVVL